MKVIKVCNILLYFRGVLKKTLCGMGNQYIPLWYCFNIRLCVSIIKGLITYQLSLVGELISAMLLATSITEN